MNENSHKAFLEETGKHPWEIDFHEAVQHIGGGYFEDLTDSQIQYYVLLALSKTLKNIEMNLELKH